MLRAYAHVVDLRDAGGRHQPLEQDLVEAHRRRAHTGPHIGDVERLEQLRLLDNGIPIHVAAAPSDTIGVDTEEDLRAAETVLSARK